MIIAAVAGISLVLLMMAAVVVQTVKLRQAKADVERLRGRTPSLPEPVQLDGSPPYGLGGWDDLLLQGAKQVRRFIRQRERFAVAMIEVSHHRETGGELPRDLAYQAGEVLLAAARLEDAVCLIDDRTFVVLITNIDLEGALAFAERARGRVSSTPMRTPAGSAYLIAVAGVVEWTMEYHTIENVVEKARLQMELQRQSIASQHRPQQAG